MPVCLVSLGSNQGDRQGNLEAALRRLAEHSHLRLLANSAWRETRPIGGPTGQGNFLNGAATLETELTPRELLAVLQHIEFAGGRRRTDRWGPRPIDLDLLFYGDVAMDTPELTVPHPRMAWRRFVLEPAAEIAAAMRHPTIGWSVARLLEHLNRSAPYVALTGPIAAGKTRLARQLARAIPARLIAERPDWRGLKMLYDSPSLVAWDMELWFLHERSRLLTQKGDSPQLCDARRVRACTHTGRHCRKNQVRAGTQPTRRTAEWTISDFWFEQSAAFARAWLPADRLPEFMEHYERLRSTIAPPRLVVLLDAPADALLDRVRRRGRKCERSLTAESLERIRREVAAQAARPDLGPVLRAEMARPKSVFEETLAAVRSMSASRD